MPTQWQERIGMPAPLVRGAVSSEELSALAALVAILASAGSVGAQTEEYCPGRGDYPRSQWRSPRRLLRATFPPRPGGWRGSAAPR